MTRPTPEPLKPCPFCGSEAAEVMWNLTAWVVVCPCSARGPYSVDESEALAAWDRRATKGA